MFKRALSLSLAGGLLSALLLLGGTAVMSTIGSSAAAPLPALIAGGSAQASDSNSQPTDMTVDLNQGDKTATLDAWQALAASAEVSAASLVTSQSQVASNVTASRSPAATVTIAQLLANPSGFLGQIVTTAGRVTQLTSDKFLINDGTGQIIVDLDDDVERVSLANGSIVTVVGKFKDSGYGGAFAIAARTLRDRSGASITDDDDDINDDDDDPARPTARPTAQPATKVGCDDDDCGPDDSDDDDDINDDDDDMDNDDDDDDNSDDGDDDSGDDDDD